MNSSPASTIRKKTANSNCSRTLPSGNNFLIRASEMKVLGIELEFRASVRYQLVQNNLFAVAIPVESVPVKTRRAIDSVPNFGALLVCIFGDIEMKKLLTSFVAVTLCLALVGCGGKKTGGKTVTKTTTKTVTADKTTTKEVTKTVAEDKTVAKTVEKTATPAKTTTTTETKTVTPEKTVTTTETKTATPTKTTVESKTTVTPAKTEAKTAAPTPAPAKTEAKTVIQKTEAKTTTTTTETKTK